MIKVGLEIHVSLNTKSKLFCSCATRGDVNENVCEICLGHPGTRLSLNKEAVIKCLKIAKALNCDLSRSFYFARKSYFYPDLSKNYQVSMSKPLGVNGFLDLDGKKINILGVHLEEDPASVVRKANYSLLDYSRSGVPLAEIVTAPDISSADEARLFMKRLLRMLKYLDVFDIDGVIKADVNVSVKKSGFKRVEVKNVTGFKDIQRVIEFECERQLKEEPVLETRGFNSTTGETYSMRKKESALDYGYIYEPDLLLVENNFDINLPELAESKVLRYKKLGASVDDSNIIAEDPLVSKLFDEVIEKFDAVFASKFFRTNLLTALNEKSLAETFFNKDNLVSLMSLYKDKKINKLGMEKVLFTLLKEEVDPKEFVLKHNLIQIKDENQLEEFAKEAINENKKAVEDYLEGEAKSLNFLVGQVMKKSKGKANPARVAEIIKDLIKS